MKPIEVLESDTLFDDSPDTGWPECKCSRCGNMIEEREMAIRVWPTDDEGKVMHYEYRYCEKCTGFIRSPDYDDDDF